MAGLESGGAGLVGLERLVGEVLRAARQAWRAAGLALESG